ncbi:MAG: MmcQ/YjbR family DNA-binding protein [Chitinophagales bacterium]|jgi:predicted DNA-binding protein (MmcQ/YjbR family)|nr:MmcQ/YjbR family DNA-binding protein [Chitinophagales bacterium]
MKLDELYDFCHLKHGNSESMPFDDKVLVMKVGNKIYLLTNLASWEAEKPAINLKCLPERTQILRQEYPHAIVPGYHMNKTHWNTIYVNELLDNVLLKDLINHSYDLVFKSLSRKLQQEIYEKN